MENKRRSFIKKTAMGVSAASIGGILPGFSAHSYGNILGANERLKVACMGVNSVQFCHAAQLRGTVFM